MTDDPISPDVRQFLLEHIDSVGELEALLILRREPEIQWNVTLIAQRLYITEVAASQLLAHLVVQRLVRREGDDVPGYRYNPESEELERLVTATRETHARHLVPVTNLIHSKSRTRIQEFADAFKLRREK
ncbi:MAG TPA: hypothetical protein VF720_00020 [Candidatus Eisenbacteria bacterium]